MVKDNNLDVGTEPNPYGDVWTSASIWVRHGSNYTKVNIFSFFYRLYQKFYYLCCEL